jgi:hypothetical protein
MAVVKVKDVLKMLRMQPGTITVCTYNEKLRTGGKRITYKDCMLTGFDEGSKPSTGASQSSPAGTGGAKNPHFRVNRTTNIRCANGDTVTIHPILIEQYNSQRVTP